MWTPAGEKFTHFFYVWLFTKEFFSRAIIYITDKIEWNIQQHCHCHCHCHISNSHSVRCQQNTWTFPEVDKCFVRHLLSEIYANMFFVSMYWSSISPCSTLFQIYLCLLDVQTQSHEGSINNSSYSYLLDIQTILGSQ